MYVCDVVVVSLVREWARKGWLEDGRRGQQSECSTTLLCLLLHCCCSAAAVLTLSWPPTSHTVKLMFLYSTVSTLKPVCVCDQGGREVRTQELGGGATKQQQHCTCCCCCCCCCCLCLLLLHTTLLPLPSSVPSAPNAPMVGMVVTISPSLSLYRMVVLPAASRPTCVHVFLDRRQRARGGVCCRPTLPNRTTPSTAALRPRDPRLAGSSHHQDAHLLLGYEPREQLGDRETHLCCSFVVCRCCCVLCCALCVCALILNVAKCSTAESWFEGNQEVGCAAERRAPPVPPAPSAHGRRRACPRRRQVSSRVVR